MGSGEGGGGAIPAKSGSEEDGPEQDSELSVFLGTSVQAKRGENRTWLKFLMISAVLSCMYFVREYTVCLHCSVLTLSAVIVAGYEMPQYKIIFSYSVQIRARQGTKFPKLLIICRCEQSNDIKGTVSQDFYIFGLIFDNEISTSHKGAAS